MEALRAQNKMRTSESVESAESAAKPASTSRGAFLQRLKNLYVSSSDSTSFPAPISTTQGVVETCSTPETPKSEGDTVFVPPQDYRGNFNVIV